MPTTTIRWPDSSTIPPSTWDALESGRPRLAEHHPHLPGDVIAGITRLKAQGGPLLQIHGGAELLQTLLADDLIDEFRYREGRRHGYLQKSLERLNLRVCHERP